MTQSQAFRSNEASALAALLAHEGRMRILSLLLEKEWDVSSLAAEVGLSQSALSQHLKKLRDARVVDTRRDAQTVYYCCKSHAVAQVLQALKSIYSGRSN